MSTALKLQRPSEDATQEERRSYFQALRKALDEAGIGYGEEFVVLSPARWREALAPTGPAAEDPSANGLGGFAADSDTSRKAALDNYPRSGSQREKVLAAIIGSSAGLTAHQVAEQTGLYYGSVTPRIGELKRGGWIVATEAVRKSEHGSDAEVLIATDKAASHG